MSWTISKEFHFDSCHSLPHLPEGHKCRRHHGHTYKVVVFCRGHLIPEMSWVIDYADIANLVKPLVDQIDHNDLNEILGITTTAENIAFWFWQRLEKKLPSIYRVDIHETTGTCCSYCPRP